MDVFESANLGNIILRNRIIRSATYEGMCDRNGFPVPLYEQFYTELARNHVGGIITGFTFIGKDGRAMHPSQAGIDNDNKIPFFKRITDQVHAYQGKIFMQIAHSGRKTIKETTGGKVYGASGKKSPYFNETPEVLTTEQALSLVETFANAALRVKQSGFDGVQIHAAHGYLIHQFILPSINDRKDIFRIDKEIGIGTRFLDMVIDRIREKCGHAFTTLVKISAGDDYSNRFSQKQFIQLIRFLDSKHVDGIEISYGTMDCALNIFRGKSIPMDWILKYNPRYHTSNPLRKLIWKGFVARILSMKIKPFTPMYNLIDARKAKEYTDIPIICVGGFRKGEEIFSIIRGKAIDFVSMCRPFICEPDLVNKLRDDNHYISKCVSCNVCAIMCDSENATQCYLNKKGF